MLNIKHFLFHKAWINEKRLKNFNFMSILVQDVFPTRKHRFWRVGRVWIKNFHTWGCLVAEKTCMGGPPNPLKFFSDHKYSWELLWFQFSGHLAKSKWSSHGKGVLSKFLRPFCLSKKSQLFDQFSMKGLQNLPCHLEFGKALKKKLILS